MSCRPTLAYVVHSLNPGGAEKLAMAMARTFNVDFDVRVVCLDEPGRWAQDLRKDGVPVHCVWRQPGLDVAIPGRLARCFRDLQAEIIHAHQCTPWFYAALSRLIYPSPKLLLEEHGRFFPEKANHKRVFANRWLIRRLTSRYVAVSGDVRSRLAQYEGLDLREIEVVYNGVVPEPELRGDEKLALRHSLGFGPDDFVVGTVGRFDAVKNLPMLIDSFAAAIKVVPNLKGLLVGDGPEYKEIGVRVESSGLSGAVRMPGFRNDAQLLIQCMDLFVLSSKSEGTSMALLEAMAAGVPVVVTDVGGNPEIVLHEETGILVRSGSVDALAKAIIEAQRSFEMYRDLGVAGRRRFLERFSFTKMIQSYRNIYDDLLAPAA